MTVAESWKLHRIYVNHRINIYNWWSTLCKYRIRIEMLCKFDHNYDESGAKIKDLKANERP